jgi:hypothetical protein
MIDQLIEYLGTTKFRFSAALCIILIILIFIKMPNKDDHEYDCPREKMDLTIKKIVKEQDRSLSDKMWVACKDGLVKGGVTGSITGGFVGAVSGGAIFAIANPVLLYINEG